MPIRFSKMHGAGNDFAVLDFRHGQPAPTAEWVRTLADRRTGIGFDQLLTVEVSARRECVAAYRIWNGDGSPAQQCGNGARCVAAWLVRDGAVSAPRFELDSPAGPVQVERLDRDRFAVSLGMPDFRPARIPLCVKNEQAEYSTLLQGARIQFGAVSMGNPHALIVVEAIEAAPVAELGPLLQESGLFPESVNVGFAQLVSPTEVHLRVFERGAGETRACGSGACAAVAILARQGRVGPNVVVHLPGGTLEIDWPGAGAPLRMAGPTAFVFEGEWIG
jgi:diaminopimelate epimerase